MLTFYIILDEYDEIILNQYFFITSLVAILIGALYLGNDKLFLYSKKDNDQSGYFNNLVKLSIFSFFFILVISALLLSKTLIFLSLNLILISINYFSELNHLKYSYKYRMILFKYLPVVFFFILALFIKFDFFYFDLLFLFTFANFISSILNILLNKIYLNKLKSIKFNLKIKLERINKESLIIWLGDILSLVTFNLPTLFFYFIFPYENVVYNIIYKFGFIPVFLISFAISKIFDYDYFENSKSAMFDAFSKTRLITFILSIIYCISFYFFLIFFGEILFGVYATDALPVIKKYLILFLIIINVSSLSTIFLINKNYVELLFHQFLFLLIVLFSLSLAYLNNDFMYFIDYFFYLSILRGILIYTSIFVKINSFKSKSQI